MLRFFTIAAFLLSTTLCYAQGGGQSVHANGGSSSANNADLPHIDSPYSECERIYGPRFSVDLNHPEGPRITIKADIGTKDISAFEFMNYLHFNLENLLNYMGRVFVDPQTGKEIVVRAKEPKPASRTQKDADLIRRSGANIISMVEVEDNVVFEDEVDKKLLNNEFNSMQIEGNDQRHINIVPAFDKNLPFDVYIQSHRNVTWIDELGHKTNLFKRDLVRVEIRLAGMPADSPPLIVLYMNHLKSQMPSETDPDDKNSHFVRAAEIEYIAKQIEKDKANDPDQPLLVSGDMNEDLRTSKIFDPLWSVGLHDVLRLMNIPFDQSVTQYYFPKNDTPIKSQLDLVGINDVLKKFFVKAQIMYHMDQGQLVTDVDSFQERLDKLGSDHNGVLAEFDMAALVAHWRLRYQKWLENNASNGAQSKPVQSQ